MPNDRVTVLNALARLDAVSWGISLRLLHVMLQAIVMLSVESEHERAAIDAIDDELIRLKRDE